MRFAFYMAVLLFGFLGGAGAAAGQTPVAIESASAGEAEATVSVTGARVPCAGGWAGAYPCLEVDLMSVLAVEDLGGRYDDRQREAIVNDLWGWTDPETGREYALVGRSDGTAFVDVTDPVNPRFLGKLPTHTRSTSWRDLKVYANHVYVVADGADDHGMQVFDLTQLRSVTGTPVTFEETAYYNEIASAHNIAINEETGFGYIVGANGGRRTCGGGLHMVDLRSPTAPSFAGCYVDDGYVHDVQCVVYRGPDEDYHGRELCFSANGSFNLNSNAVVVVDVTNKAAPVRVSRSTYPSVGYAHQGWLTEDQSHFLFDDELDELNYGHFTRTIVWDMRDLDDPVLLVEYKGKTFASDHNQYVQGRHSYQANYRSGLRILDLEDIANPREVGFFDTVPQSDQRGTTGAWSAYPFFQSGNVLVSSTGQGLFVVRPKARVAQVGLPEVPGGGVLVAPYPNPFQERLALSVAVAETQVVRVGVYDLLGRLVVRLHEGPLASGRLHRFEADVAGLSAGAYVVRVEGETFTRAETVTRVK